MDLRRYIDALKRNETLRRLYARVREAGSLPAQVALLKSREVREELAELLKARPALQSVLYWIAAMTAAAVAVVYAEVFATLQGLARLLVVDHPAVMFLLGPCALFFAWWVVARFAPFAGGSGIPQVKAAIDLDENGSEARLDELAGFRVILVVILSSLACVLGGGAVGREGSTIHVAAGIFFWMGRPFRRIWPQVTHHALLIAGGAAGIAAAFNTPLGGIVFAIEELSHHHFHRFKTHLISAVIVAGLVAQWMLGPYLFFGLPKISAASFNFLPWAIITGLLAGVGGGLFGKALYAIARRLAPIPWRRRAGIAAIAGFLMVTVGFLTTPDVMGGGTDVISRLLFNDEKTVSWGLVLGRFAGPLVTSLAGAAGGVFAPSLAAGAVLGAKIATLWHVTDANLVILLGMIGFLSGVSRAPFTSFVLVLEMTDRHSAIFPMMVTALVGSIAALLVDTRSFYDRRSEEYG